MIPNYAPIVKWTVLNKLLPPISRTFQDGSSMREDNGKPNNKKKIDVHKWRSSVGGGSNRQHMAREQRSKRMIPSPALPCPIMHLKSHSPQKFNFSSPFYFFTQTKSATHTHPPTFFFLLFPDIITQQPKRTINFIIKKNKMGSQQQPIIITVWLAVIKASGKTTRNS